jgi:uncharacterized protein (TIGR00661 family)
MKRVLITPLDWGLGHATRCIPIIRELLKLKQEVLIAGSGESLLLLKAEFPLLNFFNLPGYAPVYPVKGSMVKKMTWQIPKFMRTIRQEHEVVEGLILKEKIDLIISDNRYGCWSSIIPSVFITHQSNILMPKKFGWLQGIVRKVNEKHMRKFTRCWVPDFSDEHSLAGALISFGKIDPAIKIDYIGPLSRFVPSGYHEKKYDVVAIFSGPEPQRTLFEDIVVPQLETSGLKFFIVRGKLSPSPAAPGSNCADFLTSPDLQRLIESSALVIARSGYSTIMDLSALGKKAILVPTPGQTEQEYLAQRLMEKKVVICVLQDKFDLLAAVENAKLFSGFSAASRGAAALRRAVLKMVQADFVDQV